MKSTSPGPKGSVEIDHDDVEALGRLGHVLGAVGDDDLRARVLEGLAGYGRQILLGEIDHIAVDLHHHDALDRLVLQHLLEQPAVAPADDEDPPRVAVGDERHVAHHLVIEELVALGRLDDAVECEHAAHHLVLEDYQVLQLGLLAMDDALDLEALADVVVEGFLVPIHGPLPLRLPRAALLAPRASYGPRRGKSREKGRTRGRS